MRIDETFSQNQIITEQVTEDFLESVVEEGIASDIDEATVFLNESLSSTISSYAAKYRGRNAPEITAFQDPDDRNHVVVLAAGDNMFFRFDVMNNRVVSEERYSSFREMMQEKELITAERFYKIDHRSWFKKNWKKILMYLAGAVGGVLLGGPLIIAAVAAMVPAATAFLAGLVNWAAFGAAAGGGLWLLNKIGKASDKTKI